ncbi:MAG: class I SAM-dependent methyltransferase [Desulfovibrionales bacterium]|nr:class I SAM-dependent methyltransferase [Desulfovibrionales bacterium]
MGFYDRFILPPLVHLACGSPQIASQRKLIIPKARGRVLEVGFGTGLNLPWYNHNLVELLWALEPSEGMRRRCEHKLNNSVMDCRWLELEAEQIPLENNSIDTVVMT